MSVNTLHLSEPAGAGQLAGEGEVGEVAALRAGLKNAAGAADTATKERAKANFETSFILLSAIVFLAVAA